MLPTRLSSITSHILLFNYFTHRPILQSYLTSYSILFLILLVVGPKDTAATDVFSVTFADYEKYLPYIYANEKLKMTPEDDEDGEVEVKYKN